MYFYIEVFREKLSTCINTLASWNIQVLVTTGISSTITNYNVKKNGSIDYPVTCNSGTAIYSSHMNIAMDK